MANSGTASSRSWRLAFTLPGDVVVTESWSGSMTRSGNTVTVLAPSWGGVIDPGKSATVFGFCARGRGEPSSLNVTEVAATRSAAVKGQAWQKRKQALARAERARAIRQAKKAFGRR
ncbi:MAG: cellulose binding domain-containing protein [Solirubrobacterales bacterium]